MSDDASFTQYPSYGEKNARKSHFVAIFFIILFVVILILVGLYFLGASKKGTFNPLTVKPTEAPSASTEEGEQTPTATPTPVQLERSDLSLTVLNGSGVAGAAGDVSEILEDLGYTVESTGNASKFDYTGITILISEEKKDYSDLLKKDLADEAKTIKVEVDDNLKADAEVIVGK